MGKKSGFDIIGFVSFIAILCIGIALLCTRIVDKTSLDVLMKIAQVITYIVLGAVSFYYASSKNNVLYFGIWTVAIILIILAYVI